MVIVQRKVAALVIAAIVLKRRRKQNKKKRMWARNWIRNRETENTTQNLIRDLRNDGVNGFETFFRISPDQFDELLSKVGPFIAKQDTKMRKAISAETRLAITLRFLASGDSYRSLMLLFRVAHNTISGIVSTTCKSIYSTLKQEFLKVHISIECQLNCFSII